MNGSSCEDIIETQLQHYLASKIPPRPVPLLILMLGCFSITGLVGNALVLYVYVKKRNKLSSTVFIIALAATDFVTSAISMPYTMVLEGLNYKMSTDIGCKLYYFFITCTVPFSVFIMVAIAVDRYICICRPHSHILDSVRAKHTIFGLLILAVLIGIIPTLSYGVYLDTAFIRDSWNGTRSKEATNSIIWGKELNSSEIANDFVAFCPECKNDSLLNSPVFSQHMIKEWYSFIYRVCNHKSPLNQRSVFTGQCTPNELIVSRTFKATFRTLYSSSFLVCFAIVFVLYIMIYYSVIIRRLKRQAARNKAHVHMSRDITLTDNHSAINDSPDKSFVMSNVQNGKEIHKEQNEKLLQVNETKSIDRLQVSNASPRHSSAASLKQKDQRSRQSNSSHNCLKDKYFLANIRTAIMLFIVTLAFIIAYLPSWLTAFKVIDFNVLVFYVYFSNHIVNPFIYAFMNPGFRRSLRGLLCRKAPRPI